MEASQLPNKPKKSMRTAEPLARQSSPKATTTEASRAETPKAEALKAEANVVELPQRSPLPPSESVAPAARSSQTKRQTAKRKPLMAIRQQWVSSQQLLVDRVQSLESQAEWINQRLAERSRPTSDHAPATSPDDDSLGDGEDEHLQTRLTRIRQLLAELNHAIEHGKTLDEATAIELDDAAITPINPLDPVIHSATAPPSQQAEQAAAETASTLRHLAEKARSLPPAALPSSPVQSNPVQPNPVQSRSAQANTIGRSSTPPHSRKRRKIRLHDWLRLPQRPGDRAVDGLTWIVVAAAVRVISRILLAMFPVSPVAIVLMLATAAIILGLTALVPRFGYLPLYRLGLLTLGLLLGSKL